MLRFSGGTTGPMSLKGVISCLGLQIIALMQPTAGQDSLSIPLPQGTTFEVKKTHIDFSGNRVTAPPPTGSTFFAPPSVFSAPVPSGSGARALGLAGAFTALADDATAASWNPAGLTQLERPEFSFVYRYSEESDKHRSKDRTLRVGDDEFSNHHLNYFSLVYPLQLSFLGRKKNTVVSLNYQEAYDFTQEFRVGTTSPTRQTKRGQDSTTQEETERHAISDTVGEGTPIRTRFDYVLTVRKNTETITSFEQLFTSDLFTQIRFEQDGSIDGVTPAFGLELTPKVAIGASFNIYGNGLSSGSPIRARTLARYKEDPNSRVSFGTNQITTVSWSYEGTATTTGVVNTNRPIRDSGTFEPFSNAYPLTKEQNAFDVEGTFEEVNTYDDLEGYNWTLGLLWTVSRVLSLGATVDLPWTAEAEQTRTVRNTRTMRDVSGRVILEEAFPEVIEHKNVKFRFPLYWSLGSVWRWAPSFYTTLDVSQTAWSDFSFKEAGGKSINPLNGKPHRESKLDDTWSLRAGAEYLMVLSQTEIPLRVGFAWEERPAVNSPDDYYSLSLGSGLSVGKGPGRTIFDIAYVYTWADGINGLVPQESSLHSDVSEHQLFVSMIQHF